MVVCLCQVCISTAMFGFVSEIDHEQLFTAACLTLRAVMGKISFLLLRIQQPYLLAQTNPPPLLVVPKSF